MREIVRDPTVLDGRWHFAGTEIPIANVRSDYTHCPPDEQADYHFPNLSAEEVAAALAFAFPAIRSTEVEIQYASVAVHCECGETTAQATAWPSIIVDCVCGREWRLSIQIEPVPPGTKAAELDGHARVP
jgi:uncharacterized protein (DUF433 family)